MLYYLLKSKIVLDKSKIIDMIYLETKKRKSRYQAASSKLSVDVR